MDDETYITSLSPTVSTVEVRKLKEISEQIGPLLTIAEYMQIMDVFSNAIDRVFKENNIEEKDGESV